MGVRGLRRSLFAAETGASGSGDDAMPWRHLGLLLVGAALLLLAFNGLMDVGARVAGDDVQRFDAASLVDAGGNPVRAEGDAPVPMRLQGNCHARGECTRYYRIAFQHDPAATGLYALYIPQFTGRLQVALNGVPVTDSTRGQTSLRLGQGAPQLAALPGRLLHPGANEFAVTLAGRMGAGAVGPVYFGPEAELRDDYEAAQFLVVTLPRLMDGALFAIGAIMLMIWLTRRHDRLYLLCAAISLCFALSSMSPVIAAAFGAQFLLPVNVLRFVGACLLLPFTWHLVGRRPPVRIAWFLVPGVLMFLSFRMLPAAWSTLLVPLLFVPLALALAAVALWELWRAGIRGGDRTALTLLAVIAVLLSLTTRDQLVTAGVLDKGYVLLARFNGPLLVLIMGGTLLRRFAEGLSLLENFNARLNRDVDAARGELRAAFEREQAHVRKATLEAERMRLMGDLHDGIAGHLVSIISLCEQPAPAAGADDAGVGSEVAQASRRALTDLRLVIDSMEDVGGDLAMMLTAFRDRVEPQLRRAGIRMDWQARDLPDLPGLAPATTLAIYRILQEAVNNAAKHSGSGVVAVAATGSPLPGHGVRLEVRDFGKGGAATRPHGYGMGNMRKRAAALGASLTVESDPAGTRVLLDLPPRLDAGQDPATAGSGSA